MQGVSACSGSPKYLFKNIKKRRGWFKMPHVQVKKNKNNNSLDLLKVDSQLVLATEQQYMWCNIKKMNTETYSTTVNVYH